jgi:histidyl-tRNA synthetase
MALSTQPYKGARDFYPEDKRIQDYMFRVIRASVKKFGYQEYDAPILEPLDLYRAKTGDEIVNEQVYSFVDRGDREVAIRPEMTPTVSRMIASKRQELAYPVRWFSIPNLWRYERPQRGRLREHWQLNVDIFGEPSLAADHEIILVADAILKSFGAKSTMYEIRINSRKFMDALLQKYFGLNDVQAHTLSKLIDRMHKFERDMFEAEVDTICSPAQRDQGLPAQINELLRAKSIEDLPVDLQNHPLLATTKSVIRLLNTNGITNVRFDITLMRGFDYYTDIVFEIFDTNPENNRSMLGGGRYDGLVGLFGVDPVPTVGFGLGDVTLANFLQIHHLLPELHADTDAIVILVGDIYVAAQKVIGDLREMGLNIAVDATDRKLGAKLKHAEKQGVRYVIFVGETELTSEQFGIKDLQSGKEEKHSLQRLVTAIKDFRS